MTDLSRVGEFGVIARFAGCAGGPGVVVGVGDDAAVVDAPDGSLLLATDLLVEGRHFLVDWISPDDLGYKALAVNVSDIAAMGGVPGYALVSLALPADTTTGFVDGLREGFQEAAREYGVTLVGGDTSGGEIVVLNVALTGSIPPGRDGVTRAGARPGDLVCVTNTLGCSDGGLRLLHSGRAADFGADGEVLLRAHAHPHARVAEGLAARTYASAMIDISDGLMADLGHICEASGVGAEVDGKAVPLSPKLLDVAAGLGFDPLESALAGGEDYELLMTVAPERLDELEAAIRGAGSELTVVGRIVAGSGVDVASAAVSRSGWDHFAAGGGR